MERASKANEQEKGLEGADLRPQGEGGMDGWTDGRTSGNSPVAFRTSALWGRCPKCITNAIFSTFRLDHHRWVNRRTGGQTEGRTDGQTDGRRDGWTDKSS